MKKLKIDMTQLGLVWEADPEAFTAYVDTETGEIVSVVPDAEGYLERFYEEREGGSEDDADLTQALTEWLEASDCPKWEWDDVMSAYRLGRGPISRYLQLPGPSDSHEAFRVMEDFVATVQDRRIEDALVHALRGPKPFRRFKDALYEFPDEQERWFRFAEEREKERMREWLTDNGIEVVEQPAEEAVPMGVSNILAKLRDASRALRGDRVTFRFHPPDGTTRTEVLEKTLARDLGPDGMSTDITRGLSRTVFSVTRGGYGIATTALSGTVERNGQPIGDAAMAALEGLTFHYRVDREGQVLDIRGFAQLFARLREHLPPEAMQVLSATMNEEVAVAKERVEWNGRIGGFIRATVDIGEAWFYEDEWTLPNGLVVPYYATISFAERVACAGKDCLRILFQYHTDPGNLAEYLNRTIDDVIAAAGRPFPAPEVGAPLILGSGERVIDPATMLIYSEQVTRTVVVEIELAGQGRQKATITESRDYSFDYPG